MIVAISIPKRSQGNLLNVSYTRFFWQILFFSEGRDGLTEYLLGLDAIPLNDMG
jgi:hypothetical protein